MESKMPTPEEMVEIAKSRDESDKKLVEGGAERINDRDGNETLHLTSEQIENIRVEKEQTKKRIASVRDLIGDKPEAYTRETEFMRAVEDLLDAEPEKEKGQFGMMRELWSVIPPEARMDLISDFIFNPNAIRQRYYTEKTFQENLNSGWRK
jgi:hypothetical protein